MVEFKQVTVSDRPAYTYVTTNKGTEAVIREIRRSRFIALDCETTGLRPYHDSKLRLLSITTSIGSTFVVDCFSCNPRRIIRHLSRSRKKIIAHNWAFDANFLNQYGFTFERCRLRDTHILAFLLHCGSKHKSNLGYCLWKYLGVETDKSHQKSDWSGDLTTDQLDYAAKDTKHLLDLYLVLLEKCKQAKLMRIVALEHHVLRAVLWMMRTGMRVDSAKWMGIYADCLANRATEDKLMRAMVPARSFGSPFDWRKQADLKSALLRLGHRVGSTAKKKLALELDGLTGASSDFIHALLRFRRADQVVKAFGPGWLKAVDGYGYVHPTPQQCRPETGRFSYSDPNVQQIPRGPHRKCFLPRPGNVVVKADYSGIELRMMAHVAPDQEMILAFQNGADLHTKTAQDVLGIAEPTKNDRTLAKALNFGLIYGCGPETLREQLAANWGIILTIDECARYKRKFFNTYWGIEQYLEQCKKKEDYAWRSKWGRRRLGMGKTYNEKMRRFQTQFNKWANTPIQGNSADGMKKAIAEVYKRRKQIPGVRMLAVVHDEIVLECPKPLAFQCAEWLKDIMEKSMQPLLGEVPCVVEYSVGNTWGG